MTKPKKLERIASDLDDLTTSLDEVQVESEGDAESTLDDAKASLERASDLIDETLDPPEQ